MSSHIWCIGLSPTNEITSWTLGNGISQSIQAVRTESIEPRMELHDAQIVYHWLLIFVVVAWVLGCTIAHESFGIQCYVTIWHAWDILNIENAYLSASERGATFWSLRAIETEQHTNIGVWSWREECRGAALNPYHPWLFLYLRWQSSVKVIINRRDSQTKARASESQDQ